MFSARWHTSHRILWVFYFLTIIIMVSELPGWLAYEHELGKVSVGASHDEMVQLDYSRGVGSEGHDWGAYPELALVGQGAHGAVTDALSA
jgi:hypothetical protein